MSIGISGGCSNGWYVISIAVIIFIPQHCCYSPCCYKPLSFPYYLVVLGMWQILPLLAAISPGCWTTLSILVVVWAKSLTLMVSNASALSSFIWISTWLVLSSSASSSTVRVTPSSLVSSIVIEVSNLPRTSRHIFRDHIYCTCHVINGLCKLVHEYRSMMLLHCGSVIPSRKSLTFLFSGMGSPRWIKSWWACWWIAT